MSVEKITDIGGFTRLIHDEIGFTVCVTQIINLIPSLEAAGLYIKMLSKPNDWKFYRVQMCDEFEVGKDKLATCLSTLSELNLIEEKEIRDEKGKFKERVIHVKLGISLNIGKVANPEADLPAPDKPAAGKSAPTKINTLTKKNTSHIGHSENDRDSDNLFSEFYKAYPKKVKKDRALKVWLEKQLWKLAEDIMANIEQRKKCQMHWVMCKGQQKQYIPAPDVYLRNKGWDDELELSHKDCKSCVTKKQSSIHEMGMG